MRTIQISEERDQHRGDAIKAAKEGERYVVWMEFQVDQMRTSNYGFELRYTVFEPKTAKVVGSGYGVPQRLPARSRCRRWLRQDGRLRRLGRRDVARQVMKTRMGYRLARRSGDVSATNEHE